MFIAEYTEVIPSCLNKSSRRFIIDTIVATYRYVGGQSVQWPKEKKNSFESEKRVRAYGTIKRFKIHIKSENNI